MSLGVKMSTQQEEVLSTPLEEVCLHGGKKSCLYSWRKPEALLPRDLLGGDQGSACFLGEEGFADVCHMGFRSLSGSLGCTVGSWIWEDPGLVSPAVPSLLHRS